MALAMAIGLGEARAATNATPATTNRALVFSLKMPARSSSSVPRDTLEQDQPPVWSGEFLGRINLGLISDFGRSLSVQLKGARLYINDNAGRFALQAALFGLAWLLFGWVGRTLRTRSAADPGARPAALAFGAPLATALFIALAASPWIHPNAPQLVLAALGLATLIPALAVLGRLIEPALRPALAALMVFYFADQLRVAAGESTTGRLLMLLETFCGLWLCAWIVTAKRLGGGTGRFGRALRITGLAMFVLFAASSAANLAGYAALAKTLGEAILACAYMGLIVLAAQRIGDAMTFTAMNAPALARFRLFAQNRELLQAQAGRILGWAAVVFWAWFALGSLSIRHAILEEARALLGARAQFGSIHFTLGNIVSFAMTIWIAWVFSAVMRFALREEVYPRVTLAPGLQYSISQMAHYCVLIFGLFVALTTLGVPLTHLTIVASALTVGLGFGLQNIVNNFVSGIILLFERPVKIGDVIQVDANEGVVTRIGIRASVVRSANGAEIIVPNGAFISGNVTNYTRSARDLIIDLPIGFAPGMNVNELVKLLKDTVAATPAALKEPAPDVMLLNFTGGGLNFQIRAWVDGSADWLKARSDIALALAAAVTAKNYTLK